MFTASIILRVDGQLVRNHSKVKRVADREWVRSNVSNLLCAQKCFFDKKLAKFS